MDLSEWATRLYHQKLTELQEQIAALDVLFKQCESPVEQHFLMTYVDRWRPQIVLSPNNCQQPAFLMEDNGADADYMSVFPQMVLGINGKQYRADFLCLCMTQREGDPRRSVIVELDGHAFHERTKEQARKDKARDREMLRRGFYVFRFTGSEIYQDAGAAVDEVRTFVLEGAKAA